MYLGTNVILKYEDLCLEDESDFVITTGEKGHFMVTLFQGNFENAEEELRQMFRWSSKEISDVKFEAMDLLISCMKFPYNCVVESDIQNRNWNVSVLQDGVKKNC